MYERDQGPACKWHEERISRNEEYISGVAVQMSALSEQMKHVAEKLDEVGDRLGEDIADLKADNRSEHEVMRSEVASLQAKQEEQGTSLSTLLSDRALAEKRMAAFKSASGALALASLAALATKWGETVWEWLIRRG